jgi:hypothetical protein
MSESLIEKRNLDELWCDFLDVTYPKLDECSELHKKGSHLKDKENKGIMWN